MRKFVAHTVVRSGKIVLVGCLQPGLFVQGGGGGGGGVTHRFG